MWKPLTHVVDWPEWHPIAEIFALLANTKKLPALEQWQKEKLVSDWQKAHTHFSYPAEARKGVAARLRQAMKEKDFSKSWKGSNPPHEWLLLYEIHPVAHQFINAMVEGKRIDVRKFREKVFRPIWVQPPTRNDEGPAMGYDVTEVILNVVFIDLWQVITLYPFPFRRCAATCKKVFVRARQKQKYCDKKCANRSIGPRTGYMKKYMAEKRAAAKGIK